MKTLTSPGRCSYCSIPFDGLRVSLRVSDHREHLDRFERSYSTREDPAAIMATKVDVADRLSDFPDGTRVLTREKLEILLERLEAFYKRIIEAPLLSSQPQAVRDLQQEFRLLPETFVSEFTVPLREKK